MQESQKITVYAANGRGNAANCLYPHRIEITDGHFRCGSLLSRHRLCGVPE
jgi:hypothetical protein